MPSRKRGSSAPPNEALVEDPCYLREQLLTYIGNKRSLLGPIGDAIASVRQRLGNRRLATLDAFAGSGVVSRLLKQHSSRLVSNDLEDYAAVVGKCYLANRSAVDLAALQAARESVIERADSKPVCDGFIRRLYAPARNNAIRPGERAFYTVDNAIRIDSLRTHIDDAPAALRDFLLGPLLSEASVHANTSGVFKGFYKDAAGVGQFGGNKRDALTRILGRIELPLPVWSRFECDVQIARMDANQLARTVGAFDLAYFDPPYNQHPYGSNYFMLNLIVHYREPTATSAVSGIPPDWRRSDYNRRASALAALADLVAATNASHLLISYNQEGFIARPELESLLSRHGRLTVFETKYNAFRGSRNLRNRPIHVKEQLFLLERS